MSETVKQFEVPAPQTLSDLKLWFNHHFHCMDGPSYAFFEIPNPEMEHHIVRIVYETVAFNTTLPMTDAELINEVVKLVTAKKRASTCFSPDDIRPVLFWRVHFQIYREHNIDMGCLVSSIRGRLAIPGIFLSGIDNLNEVKV